MKTALLAGVLALLGARLPAQGQTPGTALYYQEQQLYSSEAKAARPQLLGTDVAPPASRLHQPTLALYPQQMSAALVLPAGRELYQGVQEPAGRRWVYLERASIGNDFTLWLYDAATQRQQPLLTTAATPLAGHALKPIAWSPTRELVYLEAVRFDTDQQHQGLWALDLGTGKLRQLAVPAHYISTPLLSPDGQTLLYETTTQEPRDLLHGFADGVATFSLSTRTEQTLAEQSGVVHRVAGWATAPLAARETVPVAAAESAAEPAARVSAVAYRLPWDSGRTYYVSRHGTPAPSLPHTPSGARTSIYDGIGQHAYAAIDFDTPDDADQNVRAAASGQVTVAGDCGCGYGNLVVVRHDDGTRSYYGHNKRVLVSVGQQVQTGSVLGLEGTTGVSSGDHIHFEWRAAGGNASTMGTFADVGQPRQGFPYRSSTPAPGTTPPPAADTQVPTTAIAGPASASASFTATFTDADNVGVAERFYQPLEYTGTEWRANRGNGFYNDNFGTGALHPDYTQGQADWQGSWSVTTDGRLKQSNATATNTALSTFLSQTSGNTYLYHFAARLLGDDNTRTGRFGLHIMASDVTLRERGNSYLIWFSNDDQKVRIIETSNNVLTERASADFNLAAGDFADYKASYNTSTGEIRVYQNSRPVLSWTDSTPLTTGSYVSLRTNTAQVEFDDLKVYKSRGTSRLVTVGSANSNDLRRAGSPGAKIKSLVRDAAGNWSAVGNLDVNITLPAARLAAATLSADVYPNPVTADQTATLSYTLPAAADVRADVLDHSGRVRLTLLTDDQQTAGPHDLPLQALDKLPAGSYLLRVQAGEHTLVRRLLRR